MIELLITLFLSSLVLALALTNLNHIALTSTKIIVNNEAEDHAIATLLLLQHQLEAAGLTECTTNATKIDNLSNQPELNPLLPYQVLKPTDPLVSAWGINNPRYIGQPHSNILLLHQINHSFYVDAPPANGQIETPTAYAIATGNTIVIDDCNHALITTVVSTHGIPGRGTFITVNGFKPQDFNYPMSVSMLVSSMYYLGKTDDQDSTLALFRVNTTDQRRQEIIAGLGNLSLQQANTLQIDVQPQYSENIYHASF